MIASTSIATPFGNVRITAEDDEIIGMVWTRGIARAADASPALGLAERWLEDYFAGRFRPVDFPIRARGTAFQTRIWTAIAAIPCGATRTYGEIAHELKSAPRAVGGACGANPVAIAIPCHRVLAADGGLGGYSGGKGLDTKRRLLTHEGALGVARLVA